MSKTVSLILLILLQVIYFFGTFYLWFGAGKSLPEAYFGLVWFPCLGCNYYLLYNLFPFWKNYVKSKSKTIRVFYYIGLFILAGVLTNGPTEFMLDMHGLK